MVLLGGIVGCGDRSSASPNAGPGSGSDRTPLAVVLPRRGELALVDPRRGVVSRIKVGASPWGVAVAGDRAYVSAARHVAVVDVRRARVIARVRYADGPGRVELGEYRAGGMGVAVAPDGRRVYIGSTPGTGRGAWRFSMPGA